jgi:hypothetical protein
MLKWIRNVISKAAQEESFSERSVRILPGAVYGALVGSVYILVIYTINVIIYPNLHMAVDWSRLLSYWAGAGLGLALLGGIVGWFTESYMGIIGGGVILTVLILVGNVIVSLVNRSGSGSVAQAVITALPLVGAGVLIAGGLRMAINRHVHIKQDEPPKTRRKLLTQLFGIVFLVGFIPGLMARYDRGTTDIIRSLDDVLSQVATDPALKSRFSVEDIPALEPHFGQDYVIYPRISTESAGSLDLTIRFKDGYNFTCQVSTDSGANIYFTTCNEGKKILSQ